MTRWLPMVMLLLWAAAPCPAPAAEAGPLPATALMPRYHSGPLLSEKITIDGIAVSYPKGLESQAKELAAICQQVIPPRRSAFLAAGSALSDHGALARRVSVLVGCPEHADWAERALSHLLSANSAIDMALLPMFSDVRIYREADLKASGGVHSGVVDLGYDNRTDQFTLQVSFHHNSEAPDQSSGAGFLPTVVREDGTFRTRGALAENVSGILDTLALRPAITMRAAMVHEAAELVLVRAGFSHPFTRWFSEGVANWVELQVVAQAAPDHLQLCRERLLPGDEAEPWRERINLLSWTQLTHARELVALGDEGLDEAHYPYATELIGRLLEGQPEGTLAKVVGELKGLEQPDTGAICQAFGQVTGKDAWSMLLEYVPARVRDGLAHGLADTKLREGYEALSAGRLPQAAARLKEALEMCPADADAHLNLAIVMRRALQIPDPAPAAAQRRLLESERHIALAAALTRGDESRAFQIHGPIDNEALFALGQAEHVRGRLQEAKDVLSKLPQDHKDAQQVLRQIAEQEQTPAPSPTGGATGP